ncbi:MAG: M50 family metallopeptidase [Candidatus Thermoplasmatota archaeon]|nr:M50 family metallopeptidase [Candidatus Thermoplasmatota archaeon]
MGNVISSMNHSSRGTYVVRLVDAPGRSHPSGRFTRDEKRDIAVSLVVLTAAFTMILYHGRGSSLPNGQYLALATAAGAVLLGFFMHEMGHKFTAQKYGCRAHFKAWGFGLLLALVSSMGGFLIAAPGAVEISGGVDKDRYGRISLAGPMVNLAVAVPFFILSLLFSDPGLVFVFGGIASLNLFLGIFNMLPIPPLDGSKVLAWSKTMYGMVMGSMLVFFFARMMI